MDGNIVIMIKICRNCKQKYIGQGKIFCSNYCRATHSFDQINNAREKRTKKTFYKIAESQRGSKSVLWKGGKKINKDGYVCIRVYGRKQRYYLEHRIILEKYIGRVLLYTEIVHHINSVRTDNKVKNLMIFNSHSAHSRFERDPKNVKPSEIIFDGRLL